MDLIKWNKMLAGYDINRYMRSNSVEVLLRGLLISERNGEVNSEKEAEID